MKFQRVYSLVMKLKKRLIKLKKEKKNLDREKLFYSASKKKTYDFRTFNTIRTFGEDIYIGKITLEEADKYQSDLPDETDEFFTETRPKDYDKKQEK